MSTASKICLVPISLVLLSMSSILAQDLIAQPIPPVDPPSIGVSFLRLLGALAIVLALFFAGIWLFRNWQRLSHHEGQGPKLSVLETKSLGHRQALHVVAYEQQRLLISSTPTGLSLLTHLPTADSEIVNRPAKPALPLPQFTFVEALQNVISRKR